MTSRKNAVKTISLLWISSLLGAGCAFLTQMILARKLGPEQFGVFSAAFSTIALLIPLGGFGVAQFWLRSFGQEGWAARRWLPESFKFILISTTLVLLTAISWAMFGPHSQQMQYVLIILCGYAIGQILIELVISKLQLEEEYIKLGLWQFLPHFFRLITILVILSTIHEYATAQTIAFSYTAIAIVISVLGILQLIKMTGTRFALKGHLNDAAKYPPCDKQGVFSQSWPFGMANLFYLIYFQSGLILVKYISGDAAVGSYSVALTILSGIVLFPSIVYQKFLLPKMHRWATQDKPKFYKIYRQGNLIMLLIGTTTTAIILLTPNKLLTILFGEQYFDSIHLLHILSLSIPIIFVSSSISATLTTGSNIKRRVKYMGIAAVINIALNVILIPIYGAVGAGLSNLLSNLLLLLLFYIAAEKYVFKKNSSGIINIGAQNNFAPTIDPETKITSNS